jgi:2-polyprenyl-6-methoxyphenol hydroxylase-like FAD-dependent oxidoreductase
VTNGSIDRIPHVVGVRTRDGEEIRAGLVVDAMGRRSKVREWIRGIGGRAPYEEASDAGFVYNTRHYRSRDGSLPETRGSYFSLLSTFSILSLPTDADTWVVVVVCSAGDKPLKVLRDTEKWERVVRAVPHVAHWLDGEPLQDIYQMAGVVDRYRRFVVDGQPVVTGLVAVGDGWACTNPQGGRGVTTGLRQAVGLRDAVRQSTDDPLEIAEAYDRITEQTCTPWYQQQVARDNARHAAVQAAIDGCDPPTIEDPVARAQADLGTAASSDPDVARASLEVFSCLTLPGDILARPGMEEKVQSVLAGREVPAVEGPTREQLVALVS